MSEFPTPSDRRGPVPAQVILPGGGASQAEVEESPLRKYLGAVRRHLWLVALMGLVGVGVAAYTLANTERMYTSRAVLQLSQESGGPSLGGGLAGIAASLGGGGSNLQSELQVMRSRVLLGEVVDSLGLRLQRQVPGLMRDAFEPSGLVDEVWVAPDAASGTLGLSFADAGVHVRKGDVEVAAAYGEPVEVDGIRFTVPVRPEREELTLWVLSREDAVDVLLDDVRPSSREGTNVVDVVVNGYDSIITERIANTTAAFYKRFSSRRSREQARSRRQFVMNQLVVAESLLAATQEQLTEYRKRERLYSAKAEAGLETAGRGELQLRRAELHAQLRSYRRLLSELPKADRERRMHLLRTLASAPGVGEHAVIGVLYTQLSSYEAQRDSVLAGPPRRAPTHPEVLGVDSMRAAAEARMIAASRSYVEMLEAQVAALDEIGARMDSTLRHIAETEPEEVRLALRMESIGEAATELRARYYTAGMAEAAELDQVVVLDPALAGDRSGSGPMRTLVFGLIFGLMVGGAGAVVLDGTNRSIRRSEELEHYLRVPGLGVIPRLLPRSAARHLPLRLRNGNGRGAGAATGTDLVTVTRVHSPGAEAYRTLRTNLLFSGDVEGLRSIVVTSPSGAEGKTTTAANLAIAFAQKGLRVLLVDCDLRRPRLHALFGVRRDPGLSQLLLGEAAAEEVIRKTEVERLSVLPAGPFPPVSATDLLDGGVMRSLIDALSSDFDMVILDTPPVLATANAAVLGTQVDGVVMVVRAGQTEREAARQALQQLAVVGARVVGAVLNDPDARVPRHRTGYEEEDAAPAGA